MNAKQDKNNQIEIYTNKYDNDLIQIELWRYTPNLIYKNVIDPISLYLSLVNHLDNEDTRLNNSIDELYNQIQRIIT